MKSTLLHIFQRKFGHKIIAVGILLIFFISLAFTTFFYRSQRDSLTNALIKSNLLLVGVLAHSSRIGVFSENTELLRNPVEGIFQQMETEEVAIYNSERRLLIKLARAGAQPDPAGRTAEGMATWIWDKLRVDTSPFYLEIRGKIDFWSPVMANAGARAAESLFVEESLPRKARMIGFVRITVGKANLNKQLGALLVKSALICLLFLIAGAGLIYFTVKRIVNPLYTLTVGVQSLGTGDLGKKVAVETEDEIGRLALAFNEMSETLLRRETEKTQLEERLRHAQRIEAIGTLAGGIAHDFNNIIGVIMGYAQMALLTKPGKERMDLCLQEIFQASLRAKELVKQILTFSRQDALERKPLLIKPVVEDVLKMMRGVLPATVTISHNLKSGLDKVASNPTQIHQVLMNLCTNAGYAMQDEGGVLEVTLDEMDIESTSPEPAADMPPGRYQVLTIRDTGHGMDAAVMEKIFDPFFTTKGPGKGTGMGLSVVHGIVKSHRGHIKCESEPGKGTTFKVFFPTTQEEVMEKPEVIPVMPHGQERILFVDDETALAEIGRQMLQNLGYTVEARTDSIEALEVFKDRPDQFDLLITDNAMPNMTGLELARQVRQVRPGMPVILYTGFSDEISEVKAMAIGIRGFLMKPIIWEEMARIIRQVLDLDRMPV